MTIRKLFKDACWFVCPRRILEAHSIIKPRDRSTVRVERQAERRIEERRKK